MFRKLCTTVVSIVLLLPFVNSALAENTECELNDSVKDPTTLYLNHANDSNSGESSHGSHASSHGSHASSHGSHASSHGSHSSGR